MPLKVAVQMDPIEAVDIKADSTFRILLEAQSRGHELWYYTPEKLAIRDGTVIARSRPLSVRSRIGDHFLLGDESELRLASADVVWLRQDPPFDMSYITTTHLLELVHPETLVVNDPFWVRNYPEKLLVLSFPHLSPPTAIARDKSVLDAFRGEHEDIVLKPLYGNGGAGIFRISKDDCNFNSLCEMFFEASKEPVIVQKFLPDVRNGDKRVILVDGEAVGAINRVPPPGETRSNLHIGGTAERIELTERDIEICEEIGPLLRRNGQIFAGIDVIGGYLTEINLTSPTGIVELERFDNVNSAALIWDAIERRIAEKT